MLALRPGARLQLAMSPPQWCVEKTTVDGFAMVVELRPDFSDGVPVAADAGRIVANPDVISEPLHLALLDVPAVLGATSNDPTLLLAASCESGWQRQLVTISFGGQSITVQPARAKSILGLAEGVLPPGGTDLFDETSSVVVALVDENQCLVSCDDEALTAGENLAVLGGELIQFGSALPLGSGRFQLSRLLRGRGGTEWACASHTIDEQFCMTKAGTLQQVVLPSWAVGAPVAASTEDGSAATITFLGENIRPPAPVNLAAVRLNNGDLVLSWTRRSRQGFAWVDGIDAPLGEGNEQYRVTLSGVSGAIELLVAETYSTIAAADIGALGAGELTIEVRQLGDVAASRPAQLKLS